MAVAQLCLFAVLPGAIPERRYMNRYQPWLHVLEKLAHVTSKDGSSGLK